MRYTFDTKSNSLTVEVDAAQQVHEIYSRESFEAISHLWTTVGWALRYTYQFTWLGQPIIQLPQDVMRYQELIWRLRPDVIVETGVAHGGSLLLSASLCRVSGTGHVVGVDVEIRPKNRSAIESHPLGDLITLIEGSSIEPAVIRRVAEMMRSGQSVLVLLDSKHTRSHVLSELEAYGPLVTPGSYIVVADGVMDELTGVPGAGQNWAWDNPRAAARDFLAAHPEFQLDPPEPAFNESSCGPLESYWPGGFLKRIRT